MSKAAPADYPIHDLIARRWSPRAFVPETVTTDEMRSLIEAARWAPSAANGQPWRFLVARRDEPDAFASLLGCLVPANRRWAENAGALILAVARIVGSDGKPLSWAWFDLGLAVENLALQATALDLAAHPMAGFDAQEVRRQYDLPESFAPVVAIAVGRVAKSDTLPDDLRVREEAPRVRLAQEDLVFSGEWT